MNKRQFKRHFGVFSKFFDYKKIKRYIKKSNINIRLKKTETFLMTKKQKKIGLNV